MTTFTRNFAYWQALCFMALFGALLTGVVSAHAAARKAPGVESSSILFIENNVRDYQQLGASASASLEVVVLNAQEDGLRQMADALVGRRDVAAVHLISHGAPGVVDLGSLMLDRNALVQRSADLARIRASLRRDADLLLYGCEVAQGTDGQRLITMLADATGARVAASTNPTGYLDKGGDWVLERQTGAMRTAALAFPGYRELLQSVNGTVSINTAANWVDFGATLNDNEGDGGDIPNISYDMFFANSGGTPTGTVATYNNGLGSVGTVLISDTSAGDQNNQPAYSFIIKSQAGKFKLTSFLIQDYYGMNSNYTATPYLNGVPRGTPFNFTVPQSGGYASTVTLPAQFGSVTEVRITSDGGNFPQPGNNNIWQGFNNFVFANPVYSTNANLSALSLSSGTLSPVFAANTTSYTASVGNATTSITVTPTVSDTGRATVTVNGLPVASGAASGAIALGVGSNVIATVVTAEDGSTTKTYTTTVTRAAPPSSNANLSGLALSTGTLSPAFASGTTSYTAGVPFNTVSLTVTPTVADATASVTVNGVGTTSGNASGAIALAVGNNTITTVVTAQDGTTKTYTTTVTRSAASGNAQLSALSLSSGTLAPAFASGTTNYTAGVSNATTSITVTLTLADATASVTVNGVSTASGNASGAIALAVGANTITVTVTAQNGTPLSYTITVTRAASANANLSALSLSSGTLAPVFAAGTTSYTASVSNATTSLTVTPTLADATASVTVNGVATTSGNASGAIALNVGSNTITTVVTAADGATAKTYTVTVTRAGSGDANLSALALSSGTLSPAFASGTTSYTA